MTQHSQGSTPGSKDKAKPARTGLPGSRNEAVTGPFTVRDLSVFAATVILFVASLLPVFGPGYNLWSIASLFFQGLGILLPLVVSALLAARRLAPETRLRVGSLSIDQFASVTASFSLAFFFTQVAVSPAPSLGIGMVGALILFAATVLGRFIPFFSGDFLDRKEVPAHVVAREAAAPVQKPRTPKAQSDGAAAATATPAAAPAGAARQSSTAAAAVPADQASAPSAAKQSSVAASATGAAASATVPGATGQQSAATAKWQPAAGSSSGQDATALPGADRTSQGTVAGAPVQAAVEAEKTAGKQAANQDSTQVRSTSSSAPAAASSDSATSVSASSGSASAGSGQSRESAAPASAGTPATAVHQQVRGSEAIGATVDPNSRKDDTDDAPAPEAFWFAVAQQRSAVDPRTGAHMFTVEPGAWVLALEDRGHEFLVQNTDGRVGVLRDLSNIERG